MYNKLINIIKDIVKENPFFPENSVTFSISENISKLDMNYPHIILEAIPYPISEQSKDLKLRIFILDIVDEDLKNYKYVLNNTIELLNDILNRVHYSEYDIFVNFDIEINPFNEKFDDYTGGIWCDVVFKTKRNNDICNYPNLN